MSKVNSAAPPIENSGPNFRLTRSFLTRPWLYDALALLFFSLVSLIFLIPLTQYLAQSAVNEGDDLQQMWSMGWVLHTLARDPANLFQANIFYPYPNTLAYSDHLIIQSIFSTPVMLLSNNLVLSYNLGMVFSFTMSGWGMYLLVKALTDNRAAALLSGMIFAYAPYKVGHLSQLNLLSTQWIPFCFLFFHRVLVQSSKFNPQGNPTGRVQSLEEVSSSRFQVSSSKVSSFWFRVSSSFSSFILHPSSFIPSLAFAVFFVLNALSSTYYLFFILPLLGLYFLLFYLSEWRWPRPAVFLQMFMALGLAFVVLLPTFIPYLQVSAEQAAERTPREIEQFSANYRFYVGVGENNLLWGNTLSRFSGLGGERQLFPGGLALLFTILAIFGPVILWLRRRTKFSSIVNRQSSIVNFQPYVFLALTIFSLLMSFGLVLRVKGLEIPMPYRLFYDYFPGWRGLRAAMRYGLFVLFGLSVTAGFGVAFITPYLRQLWGKQNWATRVVPLSLTGLLLFGAFWEYRSDITRINPGILPNPPQVYRWLAEPSNAGVVLELPMAAPGALPSIRNYYSTFNWQPTVGGVSGYLPPVYNDLYALSQDITSAQALATFQGMGVRWLVYHLADENTPLPSGAWEKIEAKLNGSRAVRLVQDFPQDKIKVYELLSDPWMLQILDLLPAQADIIVSDYRRNQPTNLELIETHLRRRGHALYGNDRAGYRFLAAPPAGRPVSFGLFSADEDPRPYGFAADEVKWSGHNLKLYNRKAKLAAAYDLSRDPKLAEFNALKSSLELEIGQNELKFNGKSLGSGESITNQATLNLQLSSLAPQTLKIRRAGQESQLDLPAGLSSWTIGPFKSGDKLGLTPASGATLYLNRAELVAGEQAIASQNNVPDAALLVASILEKNGHLLSIFDLYAPKLGEGEANSYLLSLDIYRRPWGTHPNGHFGVWSVALNGAVQSRRLEFDFDPIARTTRVTLDGANLDVGADVIRPGDGDWAAFIALRRADPKNPKDFELLGVSRLYEFNLNGPQLRDLNLLPSRQLVYQPSLR